MEFCEERIEKANILVQTIILWSKIFPASKNPGYHQPNILDEILTNLTFEEWPLYLQRNTLYRRSIQTRKQLV